MAVARMKRFLPLVSGHPSDRNNIWPNSSILGSWNSHWSWFRARFSFMKQGRSGSICLVWINPDRFQPWLRWGQWAWIPKVWLAKAPWNPKCSWWRCYSCWLNLRPQETTTKLLGSRQRSQAPRCQGSPSDRWVPVLMTSDEFWFSFQHLPYVSSKHTFVQFKHRCLRTYVVKRNGFNRF